MKINFKKVVGIYLVVIGAAVIGTWLMIISNGSFKEGPLQMGFHLFSEFLMATISIVSGILLIKQNKISFLLGFVSLALLIYSMLNAAGYYMQNQQIAIFMTFMLLIILTIIAFLTLMIEYNKEN
jgi:hypothetical protein